MRSMPSATESDSSAPCHSFVKRIQQVSSTADHGSGQRTRRFCAPKRRGRQPTAAMTQRSRELGWGFPTPHERSALDTYNSLEDINMRHFFEDEHRQKLLYRTGQVRFFLGCSDSTPS
mmetsp:Transcript_58/g.314  ORF Transcript_58/g.314 Transcript_58/m.314 type:complete len:118 (-) Transcript_58:2106-2459(-)